MRLLKPSAGPVSVVVKKKEFRLDAIFTFDYNVCDFVQK